jgi:hypothetical protein
MDGLISVFQLVRFGMLMEPGRLRCKRPEAMEGLKSSQIFFDHGANTRRVPGCSRRCAKARGKARSMVRLGTFRYAASTIESD